MEYDEERLEQAIDICVYSLRDRTDVIQWLNSNGINDETIKKYKIGFGEFYGKKWITLPVYDRDRQPRYFRLIEWNDKPSTHTCSSFKASVFPEKHNPVLFNEDALFDKNECVLVGSEFDTVVASQYMEELPVVGLPEVNTFKHEWGEYLSGMDTIYVCLPEDLKTRDDVLKELICQCPNSSITDISLPKGVDSIMGYLSKGGEIRDLFQDPYPLYSGGSEELEDTGEEMGLNELADILDSTIKNDRQVKTILFLTLLLMYTESDQINVCLLGPSSSGKTYTAQEVSKYFPSEDITEYAEVSPTAFKYMTPKKDEKTGKEYIDCERRGLMFTEMPHPGLLANLRPILSHDRKETEFLTTDRSKTGGNTARKTIIRGYPSVIFCSAHTKLNEQELSRFLLLSPEVSNEKLEASVELAAERISDPMAYKNKVESDSRRQLLKDRVRFIKDLHINSVIIKNYKKVLSEFRELNPKLAPRSQRDIAHLSSLIKAVAMLNAPMRMDVKGNIVANDSDIDAGIGLWKSICRTQKLGLPPSVDNFYRDYIVPVYKSKEKLASQDDGVTYEEISNYYYKKTGTFYSRDTLRKQTIPTLLAAGVISIEKSQNDGRKILIKPQIPVDDLGGDDSKK